LRNLPRFGGWHHFLVVVVLVLGVATPAVVSKGDEKPVEPLPADQEIPSTPDTSMTPKAETTTTPKADANTTPKAEGASAPAAEPASEPAAEPAPASGEPPVDIPERAR
jgi:cytoskeletal protein RodZ